MVHWTWSFAVVLGLSAGVASGGEIRWSSAALGREIPGKVTEPAAASDGPLAVVFYLKGLAVPRVGTEVDEAIVGDLVSAGDVVVVLDYGGDKQAASPGLNADVLKLRQDVKGKKVLADVKVDAAHVYVLAEGYRLRRDVEFGRDGKRVLGMDVIYPAKPAHPVGTLLEFSCDNANRMGNDSLVFCHDTLIEGGEFAGFAAAMADHPVAAPYRPEKERGPADLYLAKAAVRAVRAVGKKAGFGDGRVGVIGFSRACQPAAMLAVTNGRKDLQGEGTYPTESSAVQAAMVHGARYDFTDLGADDPMLARFERAWGKMAENREAWGRRGAIYYLSKERAGMVAPMFLDTSDAEEPAFRQGLELLDAKLTEFGVAHVYRVDPDGRGHRVDVDPKTLGDVYGFFHRYLDSN